MARKHPFEVPIWDTIPRPFPTGRRFVKQLADVGLSADDIARYRQILRETRPARLKRRLQAAVN